MANKRIRAYRFYYIHNTTDFADFYEKSTLHHLDSDLYHFALLQAIRIAKHSFCVYVYHKRSQTWRFDFGYIHSRKYQTKDLDVFTSFLELEDHEHIND